jgi:hypothetical protein
MGLEAPWALLAALLAAAPVVAHLARRHDLPRVALPTLALLLRAQLASRRRTRIVDLLLLLVRVALLVALAVGLAGPYRSVRLAYGDGARVSVALVLDDSLSMGRAVDGGASAWARAVRRARAVVDALPPGSEASLIVAGQSPRVLVPRTADLALLAGRLDEMEGVTPTRGAALPAALSLALAELAGSLFESRRVLVLSDGAAHARLDALETLPGVRLDIECLGPPPDAAAPPNVAVASAVATVDPADPSQASVLVTLRAFGPPPERPIALRLERLGGVVARAEAVFRDDLATATLRAPLGRGEESPTASVVAETRDALPGDDERGVLLRATGGLRLLLVGSDATTDAVARALALSPTRKGALAVRRIDPDTLPTVDWSSVDAALLVDVPPLGAEVAASLRRFVERGGGLALAPGESVDVRSLDDALGAVLPARPTQVRDVSDAPGLRAGDALARADDPRTELSDATGLRDVRVSRRLTLDAPRREAHVPLRFADGSPALVVGAAGSGRVALFATSLDESWSDLPLHPGFLPLVSRLARAIAAMTHAPDRPLAPGETLSLGLPPGATRLRVIDPSGERATYDGARTAAITGTTLPGAYGVEVAEEGGTSTQAPRLAFVVAPPLEESDLRPGPAVTADGTDGDATPGGTIVRRSFAPGLFLLAGLLAVTEGALRFRWQRSTTRSSRPAVT